MSAAQEKERRLPVGVWRRGPSDWAYRVEVSGYGSVYGCGFASREEAVARRAEVVAEETAGMRAAVSGGS